MSIDGFVHESYELSRRKLCERRYISSSNRVRLPSARRISECRVEGLSRFEVFARNDIPRRAIQIVLQQRVSIEIVSVLIKAAGVAREIHSRGARE